MAFYNEWYQFNDEDIAGNITYIFFDEYFSFINNIFIILKPTYLHKTDSGSLKDPWYCTHLSGLNYQKRHDPRKVNNFAGKIKKLPTMLHLTSMSPKIKLKKIIKNTTNKITTPKRYTSIKR